jgi:hypothetical protein
VTTRAECVRACAKQQAVIHAAVAHASASRGEGAADEVVAAVGAARGNRQAELAPMGSHNPAAAARPMCAARRGEVHDTRATSQQQQQRQALPRPGGTGQGCRAGAVQGGAVRPSRHGQDMHSQVREGGVHSAPCCCTHPAGSERQRDVRARLGHSCVSKGVGASSSQAGTLHAKASSFCPIAQAAMVHIECGCREVCLGCEQPEMQLHTRSSCGGVH